MNCGGHIQVTKIFDQKSGSSCKFYVTGVILNFLVPVGIAC
jgi:hypothetical protein